MPQADLLRATAPPGDENAFRFSGVGVGLPVVPAALLATALGNGNGSLYCTESGDPYVVVSGTARLLSGAVIDTFFWTPQLVDGGGAVTFTTKTVAATFPFQSPVIARSTAYGTIKSVRVIAHLQILTRSGPGGGDLLISNLPFAAIPSPAGSGAMYTALGHLAITNGGSSIKTQAIARVQPGATSIECLRFENGTLANDLAPHVDAGDVVHADITYYHQ